MSAKRCLVVPLECGHYEKKAIRDRRQRKMHGHGPHRGKEI